MKTILFYIFLASFLGLSRTSLSAIDPYDLTLESTQSPSEPSSIAFTRFFPELNLTELHLKNGMTVWLKPTDFEADEVFIKVSSKGGFASLPADKRASGELAAQIAWESGMAGLTSDQLSVRLYEHSLEFIVKIQAFSRAIEGSSDKYGLKEFLNCVHMIFTEHNLTQEGMKAAIENAKRTLSKIDLDHEQSYESAFLNVNTQGCKPLQPLTLGDLKNVDLEEASTFFKKSFSDPSEFVCVIVGSFSLAEAQSLADKYLGSIPKGQPAKDQAKSCSVSFPGGVTNKTVELVGRADCLTRVTFPVLVPLDDSSIFVMEFMCQIIEARLRRIITNQMKLSHGVDVSYQFPLYPFLDSPWISVRFRSELKHVSMLKELILAEIKRLQAEGATDKELQEIKKLQNGSEEFWLKDNCYWVSMLTNYYLWNWNPEQISKAQQETHSLSLETVNRMLKNCFPTTNYSVVTGKPPKS